MNMIPVPLTHCRLAGPGRVVITAGLTFAMRAPSVKQFVLDGK